MRKLPTSLLVIAAIAGFVAMLAAGQGCSARPQTGTLARSAYTEVAAATERPAPKPEPSGTVAKAEPCDDHAKAGCGAVAKAERCGDRAKAACGTLAKADRCDGDAKAACGAVAKAERCGDRAKAACGTN